jgi:hypothetical protein
MLFHGCQRRRMCILTLKALSTAHRQILNSVEPSLHGSTPHFRLPQILKSALFQIETGSGATISVPNYGFTCASMGHIQSKASSSGGDLCATDDSVWGVSYSDGWRSRSILTVWNAPIIGKDHITLRDESVDTSICRQKERCMGRSVNVDPNGRVDVYVS